jgi:hypothetical protein
LGFGGQVGGQAGFAEASARVPALELDVRARGLVAGADIGAKDRDVSSNQTQDAADSLVVADSGAASMAVLERVLRAAGLAATSVLGPVERRHGAQVLMRAA